MRLANRIHMSFSLSRAEIDLFGTVTYLTCWVYCRSASTWLRVTPWGIRRMLNWIKNNYNNPDVIITENGVSDRNGYLDDSMRIYF